MSLLTELHKRLTTRGKSGTAACGASGRSGARAGSALGALKQSAGFTLTEALATLIIVGLVTTILASGIDLATSQYAKSMSNSEAQILYSSLQKIMDTELRFTKTILVDSEDRMEVKGFFSRHYVPNSSDSGSQTDTFKLCTVAGGTGSTGAQEPSTPGQLGMATEIGPDAVVSTFLGEGAYNYGLQAFVNSIAYVKSGRYFVVDLAITQNSDVGNPLAQGVFTVHALNLTSARDESGTEIDLKRDPENNNSSGNEGGEGGSGTGGEGGGGSVVIDPDDHFKPNVDGVYEEWVRGDKPGFGGLDPNGATSTDVTVDNKHKYIIFEAIGTNVPGNITIQVFLCAGGSDTVKFKTQVTLVDGYAKVKIPDSSNNTSLNLKIVSDIEGVTITARLSN